MGGTKENKTIDTKQVFKICLHDIENTTERYEEMGYSDNFDFFLGQSMYNGSGRGWAGHYEDGSVRGSVNRKNFYSKNF